MEEDRVAGTEVERNAAGVIPCSGVVACEIVVELARASCVRAGQHFERAVLPVCGIERDEQVCAAMFRDLRALTPGEERRILMPREGRANSRELQVHLIDDAARAGKAERFESREDALVTPEQREPAMRLVRERDLAERSRLDRAVAGSSRRRLHLKLRPCAGSCRR